MSIARTAANAEAASSAGGGSGSAETLYAHGDRLRPLVEATAGAQTLNIYGPGGQIIAQATRDDQGSEAVRHLLADHLGSTRAALDADGNAVARFEYSPYGETAKASGASAPEVRYRYTGHPYDEAQRVYETPARGYDPTTGRFLSLDPRRQDASPYVYAGNNPAGLVDPTGGGRTPFFVMHDLEVTPARLSQAENILELFGRPPRGTAAGITRFSDLARIRGRMFDRFARRDVRAMLMQGETGIERNRSAFIFLPGQTTDRDVRDIAVGMERMQAISEQLDGNPDSLFHDITIISHSVPFSTGRAQDLFTSLDRSGSYRIRAYLQHFITESALIEGGDPQNPLHFYDRVLGIDVMDRARPNESTPDQYPVFLSPIDYVHMMDSRQHLDASARRVTDPNWEPRLVPWLDNGYRPQPRDPVVQAPQPQLQNQAQGGAVGLGLEPQVEPGLEPEILGE